MAQSIYREHRDLREVTGWARWWGIAEARADGRRKTMIEGNNWLILMQGRLTIRRRYPTINSAKVVRRQALQRYLEGYRDVNGEG